MDEIEVAVMLADISGSTALYDEVGNLDALKQVSACLDQLRHAVQIRGGVFVSSKGDDVLCTFTDPQAALDVGVEMFGIIRDHALLIHAGIDFGRVIRARDDVFGGTVNMAARLASLAKSGEVLCSQAFYDRLERASKPTLRFFGARQFKGQPRPINVYLFSDAPPEQTTEIVFSREIESEVAVDEEQLGSIKAVLYFEDEAHYCTSENSVSMGRSVDNQLVLTRPWISRSHASLEVRHDNVYLVDHSSSGTYVCFEGRSPMHVTREALMLPGPCEIYLSRSRSDPGAEVIVCDVLAGQGEGGS